MSDDVFHFRGTILPDDQVCDISVNGGRITMQPVPSSTTLTSNAWIVPGLVDAHCHIGLGLDGAQSTESQERQAIDDRQSGVLTIRDCGSPVDTHWIDSRSDLPQIIRAGRHIARPKRYIRDIGHEIEPTQLVEAVEEEIARGDGWIKLVGDWIDRDLGDLAPLWPRDVLQRAIGRAHELGARVTAHCFGEDALPDLLDAGIDCIEHGTGLSSRLVDVMAERKVALVPTLINVVRFPEIADSAYRFPTYASHLRSLYKTAHQRLRDAYEAGVPIYAGTDAGGGIQHGRIADEAIALADAGLNSFDALAAASWKAREWLGIDGAIVEGAVANFVVYDEEPLPLAALKRPRFVVLRGRVFSP